MGWLQGPALGCRVWGLGNTVVLRVSSLATYNLIIKATVT